MKSAFLVATLLCCAIITQAQPATPPTQLAQIDPAALDLLARMNWKYQHLFSYETYIDIKHSERPNDVSVIRRFRLDRGAFVWSEMTPDKNWRKWIYGVPYTSIAYDSRFPKRYMHRELTYSGPGDMQRVRKVLDGWGINQIMLLPVLSGEWPAQLLIHPALEAVSMTKENNCNVVVLDFNATFLYADSAAYITGGHTTLRFAINPETLILSRIERSDGQGLNAVKTVENYPRSRFDPNFEHEIFSSAAPLDYKLIENFDGPVAKR